MKDQDMSCKELYEAYDLSEKQQRKWLVKIARRWLKNSTNSKLNKIINNTLEVVERYIRGEATQKELEDAHAAVFNSTSASPIFTYAASAAAFNAANSDAAASAAWVAASAAPTAFPSAAAAAAYKETLLEVINEMDELERLIRKNI